MANVAEIKKTRLKSCDRMALEKYSGTYMEYSYFKASVEAAAFQNISWNDKNEISYENRKASINPNK